MKSLMSRKFILVVLTQLGNTWLCANGHIFEGVYSAVTIAVIGGYLGANVIQKATT